MAAAHLLSAVSEYLWPSQTTPEKLDAWIEAAEKTGFVACRLSEPQAQEMFNRGELSPLEKLSRDKGLDKDGLPLLEPSEEGLAEITALKLPCTFEDEFGQWRETTLKEANRPKASSAQKEAAIRLRHNSQKVTYEFFYSRTELANRLGLPDYFAVNLLQDQHLPEEKRLDVRLARYYQTEYEIAEEVLRQKGRLSKDRISALARMEALGKCEEIRWRILGHSLSSLNGTYNRVEKMPTHITVLKNHPDSCIAQQPNVHGEVQLLSPYQNKGRFFSLNLKDPEVVVVAPKKVAATWARTYPVFAYEDLTEGQRAFFQRFSKVKEA